MLLLQDLAVVPLLALIPLFGDRATPILDSIGFAALETFAIVLFILVGGRYLLRPVLGQVADAKAPEVFAAAALLVALGTAWLMEHAGLSMVMGAFVAGLLLSDSRYRHQVSADVLPFKGLLMGLFFIAVGMRLDLSLLFREPATAFALLLGLLLAKVAIMCVLARLTGHDAADSARIALLLAQAGEFGLVLMVTATNSGLFTQEQKRLVALLVILSMAVTPLLARFAACIRPRFCDRGQGLPPGAQAEKDAQVIIGGFGRVGRGVAQMLRAAGVPYLAVELNHERVGTGNRDGFDVYYGDIASSSVLRAAGAENALAVVLAIEQPEAAVRAVEAIRQAFPGLHIQARARDPANSLRLHRAGADQVVPEVLEATVQLAGAVLASLGKSEQVVKALQVGFRDRNYARLRPEVSSGDESSS